MSGRNEFYRRGAVLLQTEHERNKHAVFAHMRFRLAIERRNLSEGWPRRNTCRRNWRCWLLRRWRDWQRGVVPAALHGGLDL